MTHVIRTRLDTSTAPSDAADRAATAVDNYRAILPDSHRDYQTVTDITDDPLYDAFRARFDIRADVSAIVEDIVAAFDSDVEWLRVETRQDDREWSVAEYRDDPAYYDPDRREGHRTPPTLAREGLFEVGVGEAEYLVSGTEYSATGTTLRPDAPTDTKRTDTVVATTNGTIAHRTATAPSETAADEVVVGELEVHPGKVLVISTADVDVPTTDWTVAHESGPVPESAQ
jgi:hypothetical protein